MEVVLGYAAHEAGVVRVRSALAELEETRRECGSVVASLLSGGWSGAAADSFAAAWDDWLTGADAVVAALGEIEAGLLATGALLGSADRDVAAAHDRLHERLGR